jgi:hypothetical protein
MDEEEGGGDVAVIVSDLNATLHSEERDCLEADFNSESAGNGSSFFRKDGLGELWNTVKNFCVCVFVGGGGSKKPPPENTILIRLAGIISTCLRMYYGEK